MDKNRMWELMRLIDELCPTSAEKGLFLAKLIESDFNTFSSRELTDAVNRELTVNAHRTIQQNIMNGVIRYLKAMAENEGVDPRNEASVAAARVAYDALTEANLTHLPMI